MVRDTSTRLARYLRCLGRPVDPAGSLEKLGAQASVHDPRAYEMRASEGAQRNDGLLATLVNFNSCGTISSALHLYGGTAGESK